MKDLKYIKLFEAFESVKLSKTMRFINKDSKSRFLGVLKTITSRIDFPVSKLNDSLFEYLPFKSALKKNVDVKSSEREECNHPSDWLPGEFCHGGQVKRTWGKGTRIIPCPHCKGTGFKPIKKFKHELELIKIWFDKDGKYILTTGTDGMVRHQNGSPDMGKNSSFSRNFEDYVIGEALDFDKVKALPNGAFVKVKPAEEDLDDYVVAMIWQENDSTFFLQDGCSGSTPRSNDWQKYSKYSWILESATDMEGNAYLLKPKNVIDRKKEKDEIDPYSINNILDLSYFSIQNYTDMEKRLQGAHFALILDFKKLRTLEYTKINDTKVKRKESRKGTLALENPENIKNANLKRYTMGLVDKFNIQDGGLAEINKIVPRLFGWNNTLTFILRGINIDRFSSIITDSYSFVKYISSNENPSKGDVEYYIDRIKNRLRESYDITGKYNQQINQKIQATFKEFDTWSKTGNVRFQGPDQEKRILIFKKYLELSELLNKKLNSMPCESITDLELIYSKIQSVKRIFNEGRMENLRTLRYMVEYMTSTHSIGNELLDITPGAYDGILRELEEFKKVINS